jgi:hypothetical protein
MHYNVHIDHWLLLLVVSLLLRKSNAVAEHSSRKEETAIIPVEIASVIKTSSCYTNRQGFLSTTKQNKNQRQQQKSETILIVDWL